MLNVWDEPIEEILKLFPELPTENVCTKASSPFKDVIPVPPAPVLLPPMPHLWEASTHWEFTVPAPWSV